MQSTRTKFVTYVQHMNPSLCVHDMYSSIGVIEAQRLTATRIRLSSHNLAIERGRWSRHPRHERLCECGAIQDELHVAASCPSTDAIRSNHPDMDFNLPSLFNDSPPPLMLPVVHQIFVKFVWPVVSPPFTYSDFNNNVKYIRCLSFTLSYVIMYARMHFSFLFMLLQQIKNYLSIYLSLIRIGNAEDLITDMN